MDEMPDWKRHDIAVLTGVELEAPKPAKPAKEKAVRSVATEKAVTE